MKFNRNNRTVKLLLIVGGWSFVVLGVLGLFLPVLQGILFLLIGLFLLAQVSPRVRLLRQRLRARYPGAAAHFDEAERRVARWLRQLAGIFQSDVEVRAGKNKSGED